MANALVPVSPIPSQGESRPHSAVSTLSRKSSKGNEALEFIKTQQDQRRNKQVHMLRLIGIVNLPNLVFACVLIFFISQHTVNYREKLEHASYLTSVQSLFKLIFDLLREREYAMAYDSVEDRLGYARFTEQIKLTNQSTHALASRFNTVFKNTNNKSIIHAIDELRMKTRGTSLINKLDLYTSLSQRLVETHRLRDLRLSVDAWGNIDAVITMFYLVDSLSIERVSVANFLANCDLTVNEELFLNKARGREEKLVTYLNSIYTNVRKFLHNEARMYAYPISRLRAFLDVALHVHKAHCINKTALIRTNEMHEWSLLQKERCDRFSAYQLSLIVEAQKLVVEAADREYRWIVAFSVLLALFPFFVGGSNAWYMRIISNTFENVSHLANTIVEKRRATQEETARADKLLFRMIPKKVAVYLKAGKAVPPTSYDNVTILFTEIPTFEAIVSESQPLQIIELLNNVYNVVDDCLEIYDVYKVETIADSYVIASGLPEANGDRHALEIANLGLHLLQNITTVSVPKSGRPLTLKVGAHSGSIVASVIGLLMPRYCLFGDAMNTASRMKGFSEENRFHISSSTAEILQKYKQHDLECRGEVDIKGKGSMVTFWVTGRRTSFVRPQHPAHMRRPSSPSDN